MYFWGNFHNRYMLFSSLIFLFKFLPVVFVGNLVIQKQLRNAFLLIASLAFFAWGGASYTAILVISLIINYFVGRLIDRWKKKNKANKALMIGVVINLLILLVFKYADFFISNYNFFRELFRAEPVKELGIVLPIGISFYTFQAISYLVDVYRGETAVQKNFTHLALYISFFPQLIAGPIVRYHDIAKQITNRTLDYDDIIYGIKRFIFGLAKKVLIANQFGYVADQIFASDYTSLSPMTAWVGALAYSLQIYFDFSGYSDMAIGLARMFGFRLLENFNFPYVAQSIQDFWRRWHISLSNWFKDYLYIPLGGNRKGSTRTLINLLIVFFITGFWHGASWNFIVWGLLHGAFLMFERLGLSRLLANVWSPLRHIYTLFVVVLAWVLFRAETLSEALQYIKAMFGGNVSVQDGHLSYLYINPDFYLIAIIGILGSTYFFKAILAYLRKRSFPFRQKTFFQPLSHTIQGFALIIMLSLTTMALIASSYNPFIYFRF